MHKSKNLDWIDDIKGSVILLVILYHSVLNFKVMYGDFITSPSLFYDLWLYFNAKLAPLRMPIFFFISGFLVLSYLKRTTFKEVFKGKALNFLSIYIIWNIIVWTVISFVHYVYGDSLSSTNAVYADNLISFLKSTLIGNSSLWYLFALACYYCFCKLFIKYPVFLIIFSFALNVLLNEYIMIDWYLESIGRNLVYFVTGLVLGKNIITLISNNKKYALALTFSLIISTIFIDGEWRVYRDLSFCLFFLTFFMSFEKLIKKIGFRKLGKKTLIIYVSHRIFVEICMITTLIIILNLNSDFIKNLVFLIYPILTCIISVLFAVYFEKLKTLTSYNFLLSPIVKVKKI